MIAFTYFYCTFLIYPNFLKLFLKLFTLSQWDFSHGKPDGTESCYLIYGACWVFLCFCNAANSDFGYKVFNVCTDVNACDCTQGCTNTVRDCALKVDSGRKIPCGTGESNLCQRHASRMLYQLSYMPTPWRFNSKNQLIGGWQILVMLLRTDFLLWSVLLSLWTLMKSVHFRF